MWLEVHKHSLGNTSIRNFTLLPFSLLDDKKAFSIFHSMSLNHIRNNTGSSIIQSVQNSVYVMSVFLCLAISITASLPVRRHFDHFSTFKNISS